MPQTSLLNFSIPWKPGPRQGSYLWSWNECLRFCFWCGISYFDYDMLQDWQTSLSLILDLQQLVDFIKEVVGRPTVLVGNSIGSLACMVASAGIVNKYQCAELYFWPLLVWLENFELVVSREEQRGILRGSSSWNWISFTLKTVAHIDLIGNQSCGQICVQKPHLWI